jgi:hypothetical protein
VALTLKGISPREKAFLLTQLSVYPKARKKLPSFTAAWCAFTEKSYEQSSSELLAGYKASLVVPGSVMLDLCGGLGVDDWAFGQRFNQVISLDTDRDLNEMVRENFHKLGFSNVVRLDADATEYVEKSQPVDLIYADADRRPLGKRVPSLDDARPDIPRLQHRLLELSPVVMLKLSPMLDITDLTRRLSAVAAIYVVSQENEVKEVLVLLHRGQAGHPSITAVEVHVTGVKSFQSTFPSQAVPEFGDDGTWFYEPAAALIKAGLSKAYASENKLKMMGPNANYFTSTVQCEGFFGRTFRIVKRLSYSRGNVKSYLDNAGISIANIAKRNFPMEVSEIRKLFLVEDGGADYLFFTQNRAGGKFMFHCRKP